MFSGMKTFEECTDLENVSGRTWDSHGMKYINKTFTIHIVNKHLRPCQPFSTLLIDLLDTTVIPSYVVGAAEDKNFKWKKYSNSEVLWSAVPTMKRNLA
jgi:hypothetical protein